MKAKYYVLTGKCRTVNRTVKYWTKRDGINYYYVEGSRSLETTPQDINWKDLLRRKVVREVKVEELPLL